MHVIQLAPAQWLVLDDATRPRFLIVQGPLIDRATGETHIKHRVEFWAIVKPRTVLAVLDGLVAAETWCRDAFAKDAARASELHRLSTHPRGPEL